MALVGCHQDRLFPAPGAPTPSSPDPSQAPPMSAPGAPEVQGILEGKIFIERVSTDLTNPYFDLVPFNPEINTPKLLMAAIPAQDLNHALAYGFRHVVLKPGFEKMPVPPYVIFHEPVDFELLKSKGFQEYWVDNKPGCDDRVLFWCAQGDTECQKKYGDPETELKGLAENVLSTNSKDHPACKPSLLINAICHSGSHWADPQEIQSIIRIRGGRYEDPYLVRFCRDMVITNADNETVEITTYSDIAAGSPEGPWQQVDPARNIWAVKWDQRKTNIGAMLLDDDQAAGVTHYDNSTIAPDHRRILADLSENKSFQVEDALVDVSAPAFKWIDVHVDPAAKIQYEQSVSDSKKNGTLPYSEDACMNTAPLPPLVNPQDRPLFMLTKHTAHCLKESGVNNRCARKPGTYWKEDARACCHWSSPHVSLEGGSCEPNYFYLTPFKINQASFFPNICAKVGAVERCLALKLPAGKQPADYQVKVPLDLPADDAAIKVWSAFGPAPDFPTKNVLIRGVRLTLGGRSISILGHPGLITDTDPFLMRFDGVEMKNSGEISVVAPSKRVIIENSYFTRTGRAVFLGGDEVTFRNNYIYDTSPGKTVVLYRNPTEDEVASSTALPWSNRFVLNVIHSGGGLDGSFSGWEIAHNVFYDDGGQEVMEPGGEWLVNTRIADNWFVNNRHFGIGICVSGNCYRMKIKNLLIENNQFFAPTYAAIDSTEIFYVEGSCENMVVRNNLVAELGEGQSGINLPTFCKNSIVSHNTVTSTVPSLRPGLSLAGYLDGMQNFRFEGNLTVGTDFALHYEAVDNNPSVHNFGAGEFLQKCQLWHQDAIGRCGTDALCQADLKAKMALRCTADLGSRLDKALNSPNQFSSNNNYFEDCQFRTGRPATDSELKLNHCFNPAISSWTTFAAPQFRDYHLLSVTGAMPAGDGEFPHAGACYLDERPGLGKPHTAPTPVAAGLNPEEILQLVKKSRSQ